MIYKHRSVLLASKHYKEQAIAPIFRDKLACNLIVADISFGEVAIGVGGIKIPLCAAIMLSVVPPVLAN